MWLVCSSRRPNLLHGTRDSGENVIGIRANQTNCAHYDYKDHGQHHGVFRDVLTRIITPELEEETAHGFVSFRLEVGRTQRYFPVSKPARLRKSYTTLDFAEDVYSEQRMSHCYRF